MAEDLPFNYLVMEGVLIRSSARCWSCGQATRVLALGGLDGAGLPVAMHGVTLVDPKLEQRLRREHPYFHVSQSRTSGLRAYFNHCERCGKLQGDHFLFNEPDGPFFALDQQEPVPEVIDLKDSIAMFVDPKPYEDIGSSLDDEDEEEEQS